ncbi:hypothetical protein DIPPA_10260 [Diplonema papillatum]|nr:hypothetical protein DIPPA_10260 [Diplonema papillatum]
MECDPSRGRVLFRVELVVHMGDSVYATLTDVLMLGLNGPYERGSGIPRSAMEAYLNAWIASPRTLNFATWPEYEACVDKEGVMRKI